MENYFDIATEAEIEEYFGERPTPEMIADHKKSFKVDKDLNLQHLYWLFLDRGQPQTAQKYFDLIEDEFRKIDAANVVGDSRT